MIFLHTAPGCLIFESNLNTMGHLFPALAMEHNRQGGTESVDAGAQLSAWSRDVHLTLEEQRRLLALRTMPLDRSSRTKIAPYLRNAATALHRAEGARAVARAFLRVERAHTRRAAELRIRAMRQATRIALIRARLPPHLQTALDKALAAPQPATTAAQLAQLQAQMQAQPEPEPEPEPEIEPEPEEDPCEFPQIKRVTAAALAECPQYVRGRLTAERVAGVVEKINHFVRLKYELLSRPAKQVKGPDRDRRAAFRANAEDPNVKGQTFVSDAELKAYTDFKMDATTRSTINVLRHLGALKEIRGKNNVRCFIVR